MTYATTPVSGGMFDSTQTVETVGGFPRGDKAVDAEFFAKMISSFYKDGVLGAAHFAVTAGEGLGIAVSPGVAWVRGYMAWQKETVRMTLTAGTSPKLVLRLNLAAGEFNLVLLDDTGSLPLDTETTKDLLLAEITVPAGATAITAGAITDTRADPEKCGYVTSAVDALDTVGVALNAMALGGNPAASHLLKSGGTMTGALRAAADGTGASVVRNISYGTSLPSNLGAGELFVLIPAE